MLIMSRIPVAEALVVPEFCRREATDLERMSFLCKDP